jgi:hypothetical protein
MASPFNSFNTRANVVGEHTLYLQWTSGASGAIASIQRQSEFLQLQPIVRQAPGIFDIFLLESWVALLSVNGNCLPATFTLGTSVGSIECISETVSNVAQPKLRLNFYNVAGSALTDPIAGDVVKLAIVLTNMVS